MSDSGHHSPAAEGAVSPSQEPKPEQTTNEEAGDVDPDILNDSPPTDVDSDNDSVLSDLDDEAFENYNEQDYEKAIPIDTDTLAAGLGRHKRKAGSTGEGLVPKKQGRRRRDKRSHEDEGPEIPVEIPLTEEEKRRREIEKQMDDAIKGPKKKRKKRNDHDLEKIDDDKVDLLRMQMLAAADQDRECVQNGQPAIHKIRMVDEVRTLLSQQSILSVALDGNILRPIRQWLEPLPNRSLPAYNVQKLMFEILGKLRPDVEHLRESGIGKIVMFYTKDSRPELHIKREAEKLVREWSRPILGKSDDYRSREVRTAGDGAPRAQPKARDIPDDLAPPPRASNRARALLPNTQSYEVAPKSQITSGNKFAKPMGAAGDEFIRRMKAKKAAQRSGKAY
ncbi:hypothetical protein EX30DRAFT_369599 [Ascodesmis nigricans]|uniref:TFIIS N-terminal domain-containing protein n=1 Tax=Ascodesmis nigricans TaxID=341454 RepID=A0A4S2N527_9PEZI|nr:hypothetical protein EX30DRAFT_369599 [Ascodesmis nigricans]